MNIARRQRGMSIWMLMYVLVTLAVFGYIGLKLFPLYMEAVKVDRAISAVATTPGTLSLNKRQIVTAIVKRLDIDGVYRIKEHNAKEFLTITNKKGRVRIRAAYDAEVPLFYNIVVIARFDYAAASS